MSEKDPSFRVALVAGGCAGEEKADRMQSPQGFYKAGGFKGVYNGMFAAAAGSAPGAALFFSTYETVKHAIWHLPPAGKSLLAGSECQLKIVSKAGLYPSTRKAVKGIFEQNGYRGLRDFEEEVVGMAGPRRNTYPVRTMRIHRWRVISDSFMIYLEVKGLIASGSRQRLQPLLTW
eukprot:344807-Hanusia_phi.AAC.20